VIVLGIAQDGGIPQAGTKEHKGWDDDDFKRHVVCLAVIDPVTSQRWMIDCTPDFPEQLHDLDELMPVEGRPGLDGIFLTHAHMGHYTGLMHLGHESMGAREVPVHAMPRMFDFLSTNGPWDQLVRYENIALKPLSDGTPIRVNPRLTITPFSVPHRQEYSEVVGYRITGPSRSVVFIPDIDSWEEWDDLGTRIETVISEANVAYLDGTFYSNDDIPGRDISGFPHPFITHTMTRLEQLSPEERGKIRFLHLNHTNPVLLPGSDARDTIEQKGFGVADEMERVDL
jgi:pyrroloquinoline quinone biosynthesis protein B